MLLQSLGLIRNSGIKTRLILCTSFIHFCKYTILIKCFTLLNVFLFILRTNPVNGTSNHYLAIDTLVKAGHFLSHFM